MKVIRQTIRESVRKLPIPPYRTSSSLSPSQNPSPAQTAEAAAGSGQPLSSPQLLTLEKRRTPKVPDTSERHSMDMDEKVGSIDFENVFRTRSKTIGDLIEAGQDENASFVVAPDPRDQGSGGGGSGGGGGSSSSKRGSPCSSMSNLSSSSHSGSARLQYASSNPINYSTTSVNSGGGGGSPVWKPRSESVKLGVMPATLTSSQEDTRSHGSSGSKDSSESDSRSKQTKTVVFQTFDNFPVIKDTEC